MPSLKLLYFNGRGRMEPLRWILECASLSYQTEFISFEQWPNKKPTTPYNSMPVLYVDEDPICETLAIARYIGATAGFVSSNHLSNAFGDTITDITADLVTQYFNIKMHSKEPANKEQDLKKLLTETIPGKLKVWEPKIKGSFIEGEKMMWQDVFMSCWLNRWMEEQPNILQSFPKLSNVVNNVKKVDNLKNYLAKKSTYDLPL